jgi:hypothetical protein
MLPPDQERDPAGSPGSLMVGLLYETSPMLNAPSLIERIRKYNPGAEAVGQSDAGQPEAGMLHFVYPDHPVDYKEGSIPAQTVILTSQQEAEIKIDEMAMAQTWDWPGARDVVGRARQMILVTDMMSMPLERAARLALIQGVLHAVLEEAPPLAMHWFNSQRYVDPQRYLDARNGPDVDPLYAAFNVRLFRIENQTPGEMIMDSVGLARFGLPDLQCHFKDLEPGEVAGLLNAYIDYIFNNGDVIEDGHTVQGLTPDSKWRAQHEASLVKPDREVLDLDPGAPYAAGGRD